jgi:hypothetical protein
MAGSDRSIERERDMPIAVTRDQGRRRLTAVASGAVSVAMLGDFVRTARIGDLRMVPMLFDARSATFEMTAADLRDVIAPIIAGLKAAEGARAPVAIVVEDSVAFQVARMFETLVSADGMAQLGVFRDLAAAEQWLTSITDTRR